MSEEREKRVQRFLVENKKYFPQNRMSDIKKKIEEISDEQFEQIEWLEFKDPSMMTIVAVFLGHIGVDRFMLDDVKNGQTGMTQMKIEGEPCTLYYGPIESLEWSVFLAIPTFDVQKPFLYVGGALALLAAIAILMAYVICRRLRLQA